MARAQFNVLVLPYRFRNGEHEYAVFHRASHHMWQFIAGGGEDDETPFAAAKREALEEAGIEEYAVWIKLDSIASVPRSAFSGASWTDTVYVIPEYCFAVGVGDGDLRLSDEHDQVVWSTYEDAHAKLTWDSNRVALWELRERLEENS
jgi:dATP pyrophosphohydrolase